MDKLKNSVGIAKIGMKANDIEEDGKDKRQCHQHKSKGQSWEEQQSGKYTTSPFTSN